MYIHNNQYVCTSLVNTNEKSPNTGGHKRERRQGWDPYMVQLQVHTQPVRCCLEGHCPILSKRVFKPSHRQQLREENSQLFMVCQRKHFIQTNTLHSRHQKSLLVLRCLSLRLCIEILHYFFNKAKITSINNKHLCNKLTFVLTKHFWGKEIRKKEYIKQGKERRDGEYAKETRQGWDSTWLREMQVAMQ